MSGHERRTQLIEVAIDLFSRKGFRGTTTREIAAAAGVTEAIIFRHFATKQDLYTAILDFKESSNGLEAWSQAADSAMDRKDDEALFGLIVTHVLEAHRNEPRFERLMMHAALEGHELAAMHHRKMTVGIGARLTDYIERRQKEGALMGCNPKALLFAVAGIGYMYALHKYMYQLESEGPGDEQMIEDYVRILMNGLTLKQ